MIWSVLGKDTTSGKLRFIAAKALLFGVALVVLLVGYAWGSDEPQIIEPPIASDLSFGSSNNKNIAMAGVDYDGDGVDEIAVIRENLNGIQRLFIFNAPQGLQEDVEPIATDLTFGSSTSEQKNIAMAGVDIDGNGIDEITVIREKLNGEQQLIIFNAPQGVDGETGASMASDITFGNYNYRNNIALAGVDINGDGIDEIAVVKERPDGRQRLFIYNAPQSLEDEIEPAIATDMRFGDRYTRRNIIGMTGIDINGDGVDEIAVIRQGTAGWQRLEIYNAPQGLGIDGGTGLPIASDLTFGHSTSNHNNIAMAGIDINGDGVDEIAVIRERTNGRQRLFIFKWNDRPTANAGPDQIVDEGVTVTLDGSNSTDPDDGITSYLWEQTDGTPITLSDPNAVQPTFTAPDVGPDGASLTFQLTVTDNGGLQATDTCIVNITGVESDEQGAEADDEQETDEKETTGFYGGAYSPNTSGGTNAAGEETEEKKQKESNQPAKSPNLSTMAKKRPAVSRQPRRIEPKTRTSGGSEKAGIRYSERLEKRNTRRRTNIVSFFNDEGIPNVYIKGILHCGAGDPRNVAIAQLGDGKRYRIREGDIFSNSDIKVVVIFPRRLQLQYNQHIFEVEI